MGWERERKREYLVRIMTLACGRAEYGGGEMRERYLHEEIICLTLLFTEM